jgi:hypothetical protein
VKKQAMGNNLPPNSEQQRSLKREKNHIVCREKTLSLSITIRIYELNKMNQVHEIAHDEKGSIGIQDGVSFPENGSPVEAAGSGHPHNAVSPRGRGQ